MKKAERLRLAYQHLRSLGCVHTQKDVAEAMGATKPNVSSAMSGNDKFLTDSFLSRFNNAFGNVFNLQWLLIGEGEMLNSSSTSSPHADLLADRDKMVVYADDIRDDLQGRIICYDLELTCGFNRSFLTPENRVGSIDLPNARISPEAFAVQAFGDSMLPTINNADWVVLRQVQQYDYVDYGKIYAVLTDDHNFLKRIRKHPESPQTHYLLVSDNSANYDPIDLPKSDIRQLFIVEHIVAFRAV